MIKKMTLLFAFLAVNAISAQITFDFESISVGSPSGLAQTVSGITVTVDAVDGGVSTTVAYNGFGGMSGNQLITNDAATTTTFTFSEPVTVNSLIVGDFDFNEIVEYTLTPTGGSNSPVTSTTNFLGIANTTLSWTDVTSFTITLLASNPTAGVPDTNMGFSIYDDLIINGVLDVAENSLKQVEAYPNPVNDILYLKNVDNINSVTIYNSLGQLIKETNQSEIDFSRLKKGLYFLYLNNENGVITKKIVKN
ncbi:T9SS type A sorting domain-containing protein [Flavivirga rizhaonensis]|uniref:T9SS type A sorting domain-containing protein n=1 Tax=Flavivirga rizhaonensis TaxID=2559571 RepID=A0A4S1DW58_9FLAO|nr:T9SS type A sorting domain-containing protein [Flavivirga rizhaonensis]TGV02115.1 T9SS type A sorting domain-containing protein [Flavivirga rizhaonensis]